MRLARLLSPVILAAGLAAPAHAASSLDWGCVNAAYCNRAIAYTRTFPLAGVDWRGDFAGFRSGRSGGAPSKGWSGLERLSAADGRFFVAASGRDAGTQFDVVQMGSRRTGNVRLGSNRHGPDPQNVRPPDSDRALFSVYQDPGFDRTGSPSALGDLLAVPIVGPGNQSRIALYDVHDPAHPERFGSVTPANGVVKPATTVALAQLKDGSYLMVLGNDDRNQGGLDFYTAPPGGRPTAWARRSTWRVNELRRNDNQNRDFGYTSLHVVALGHVLYLLGGVQKDGKDRIDTIKLDGTVQQPRLTKLDHDYFRCRDADVAQCDFNAGPSVFVTQSGAPLIYGVQRKSVVGASAFTRFEEFRDTPPSRTCTRQTEFVQLFDDSGLGQDYDRFLLLDSFDFPDGVPDLGQQSRFNDKASAAQWCVAGGDKVRLYEDRNPCSGGYVELSGVGVRSDDDFKDTKGTVQHFNDRASCVQWIRDPANPVPTATPTPTPVPTGAPTPTPTPDLRADLVISAASKTRFTVTNQGRTNAPAFKVLVQSAGTFAFTGLAAGASTTKSFSTGTCLDTRSFKADVENTVAESKEDNNETIYPEHCAQAPGRR